MSGLHDALRLLVAELRADDDCSSLEYCERLRIADRLDALLDASGREWRPVSEAPVGVPVLLAIEYAGTRKRKVLRAVYAAEKTLPLGDEQDSWPGCTYDETEEQWYVAPGWYETNEYEETNWHVSDAPVGWQPLPTAPTPTERNE
jgi:hypothetical protein